MTVKHNQMEMKASIQRTSPTASPLRKNPIPKRTPLTPASTLSPSRLTFGQRLDTLNAAQPAGLVMVYFSFLPISISTKNMYLSDPICFNRRKKTTALLCRDACCVLGVCGQWLPDDRSSWLLWPFQWTNKPGGLQWISLSSIVSDMQPRSLTRSFHTLVHFKFAK